MNLQEVHERVLSAEVPEYDPRMSGGLSKPQYLHYVGEKAIQYYSYLSRLVRILKPAKILELGTDIGRSASFMMLTLPKDSTLITIEIHQSPRQDLEFWKSDPRLKIVVGNDLDLRSYGTIDLQGIDLLFIDALHDYGQVAHEWALYKKFMSKGALVLMDDIHLNPGMERFWNELPYEKIDTGKDLHFSGFGIFTAPEGDTP